MVYDITSTMLLLYKAKADVRSTTKNFERAVVWNCFVQYCCRTRGFSICLYLFVLCALVLFFKKDTSYCVFRYFYLPLQSIIFLGVMSKVRITAVRQTIYRDLMKKYENPILHTCTIRQGQEWISVDGQCPDGMCASAWASMREFVESLSRGEGNFFDGWMRNPMSAMISCNDGFRPMSFYIEVVDENLSQPTLSVSPPQLVHMPISKAQERIHKLVLAIGDQTRPRRQIIAYLGLKQNSRCNFINNYLRPAMSKGYIIMARPSSPNSPEQAYRLSEDGLELWSQLRSQEQE